MVNKSLMEVNNNNSNNNILGAGRRLGLDLKLLLWVMELVGLGWEVVRRLSISSMRRVLWRR